MKIKAIYTKRIEIETNISKKELDNISLEGPPVSLDYMADEIDNVQPPEFDHYILLESDNEEVDDTNEEERYKKLTKKQRHFLGSLFVGLIISIIESITNGIIHQDVFVAFSNFCIFWIIYLPVTSLLFWINKVTRYMKVHDPNWKY